MVVKTDDVVFTSPEASGLQNIIARFVRRTIDSSLAIFSDPTLTQSTAFCNTSRVGIDDSLSVQKAFLYAEMQFHIRITSPS